MRSGPHDIPSLNSRGTLSGGSPHIPATPSSSDQHPDSNDPNAHKNGKVPPAWADMKTKAGKDRKRLPLACIACRRKKIRCSGEKPACKHCLKSRLPCVYKVTTRKAAPRTDYMAMLDKRLKRMEDRVIRIIPKDTERPTIPRAIVKPSPLTPASQLPKKRSASEAFGGAGLDVWAATAASGPGSRKYPDAKIEDQDEARLLTEGADSLPSPDIQEHLVEVYFDHVYGQSYYLLHKPSFTRLRSLGKVPPVLLLAVCAISARFSDHPQLRTDPAFLRGESWAAEAQKLALKRLDNPNITILTVMLLLGLHAFGTCQGGRSWMLGGIAHRMAYALRLHRELEHDPTPSKSGQKIAFSFLDREIRRRTMWACFMMDRFNSSGSERPMFANEHYLKVQLPVREDLFQMELPGQTEMLDGSQPEAISEDSKIGVLEPRKNLGVAAFNVRIIALLGRLVQYWNLGGHGNDSHSIWEPRSAYKKIASEIEVFEKSLPDYLRYNADNLRTHATEETANQFLFLHIAYNQVVLFLHRFAFPATWPHKPSADMPPEFLKLAQKTAIAAASSISRLVGEAMDYKVVVPFAGYSAYLSGAVHVHIIFSRAFQLEMASKELLTHNIKYLTKMKQHWGMFYFLTESLKELYRFYADAAGKGALNPESRAGAKRVFQYGDWYDRYPRGVSQAYYEEPAAKNRPANEAVLSQKTDLQSVEDFFASNPQPAGRQGQNSKRARTKSNVNPSARPASNAQSATSVDGKSQARTQRPSQPPMLHHKRSNSLDHMDIQDGNFTFHPPESYDRSHIQASPNSATSMQPPGLGTPSSQHAGLINQGAVDMQVPLDSYGMGLDMPGAELLDGNNFWDMDFSSLGSGGGAFGDPSNAWFMPFDINVPGLDGSGGQDYGAFGAGDGGAWSASGSVGPGTTPGSGGGV
ncbi:hypothetical protein FH972_022694 [Carpinus fangiana]|uniref:Zn(2)-C6 fungal-type domain-containing protein n=1 Tax=Carpinus fangiana TaxID=176857 RepID=A0A5N6KTB1_9ROSI|nr:hypothetical protein FH972_022694 [Carpinus fangiana]